jgi:hypothetical protein
MASKGCTAESVQDAFFVFSFPNALAVGIM